MAICRTTWLLPMHCAVHANSVAHARALLPAALSLCVLHATDMPAASAFDRQHLHLLSDACRSTSALWLSSDMPRVTVLPRAQPLHCARLVVKQS
jgi:hypothetical protein